MTTWANRALEERVLLNPAFCASLLWHFASKGEEEGNRALTLTEAFLVLPIVLPRSSREALPRSTRTSLPTWLDENPSFQATLAIRARAMVPFTRDALIFGGSRQLLQLSSDAIRANDSWRRKTSSVLRHSSAETQACLRKAAFLGTWFCDTGPANTVMALMGVRP
jgi:hypothetical protein